MQFKIIYSALFLLIFAALISAIATATVVSYPNPSYPQASVLPYCGDGICNNGEVYETCPQDCPSQVAQIRSGLIDCQTQCCENYPNFRDKACPNPQTEKCLNGMCVTGEVCQAGEYYLAAESRCVAYPNSSGGQLTIALLTIITILIVSLIYVLIMKRSRKRKV